MRIMLAALMALPVVLHAQTDYFNTDRGRPLHVQDAIAIERYAHEFQLYPVHMSHSGGRTTWWFEPGLAIGVGPRTQMGMGVSMRSPFEDGFSLQESTIHLSFLHALNVETLGMPAFALSGALGLSSAITEGNTAALGLLATRTTALGRVHLNADATVGRNLPAYHDRQPWLDELSRWAIGVGFDRAIPLRSILLGADLVARRSMVDGADLEWDVEAGVRLQLNPQWVIDGGMGRTLGPGREWSLTLGLGHSYGTGRRSRNR